MAKLEAVIDADVTPFQRALKLAIGDVGEFKEKAAGLGSDLLKSLSGINIEQALGIGVAIYAAQKLGDALIDAAKEGLKAFNAYQDAVLKFKYTIPVGIGGGAAAGGAATEAVEAATAKAGLFSADSMRSAALYLLEGSKEFRESPEKLNDMLDSIKALALKTGGSPEAIAESYRRLVVGIKEEGSQAVGKFFKSTPGLEAETEKMRDAHAEAYLHAQGLTDASQANTAQASEYHRLQREPISEFMVEESKRKGAAGVLEEIKEILERSAPKAIVAEAEAEHPEKKLAALWEEVSTAFGSKLKPVVDDFTNVLISAMPAVKTSLVEVGKAFQIIVEIGKAVGTGIYNTALLFDKIISVGGLLPSVFDSLRIAGVGLAEAWSMIVGHAQEDAEALSKAVDERIAELKAEKEAKEAPEKSAKAALEGETGVFSKERQKSEEEIAKINAKTDAAHEESQRRIAASQAGMGAIEEEAANRIAKINEEATIRNIERQATQVKDDSEEKRATLERLNAEDAAAERAKNDIMAEAREKQRVADKKNAEEIAKIQLKSAAEHEASQRRINFEAAAADLRASAHAAARRAVIDRPRGATEELDKEYAAQADAAAKIINIKAEAQAKFNAAEKDAADRIATINKDAAERDIERQELATHADSEEKSSTLAKLNAEDAASATAINDAIHEAREKEREADMDAANAIIDAQEEAAEKIIDAQEAAALAQLDKMKGPFAMEEAPGMKPEWGHWKGGVYIESEYERKQREERNEAATEANRQWKELMRMGIVHEFEEKKRVIEDALERQRPTLLGLKQVHILQQEEHVKAIEAEKGRTEADIDFAKAHEGLGLEEPKKEPTGKADISRSVLAQLLIKIFANQNTQIKEFETVFLT